MSGSGTCMSALNAMCSVVASLDAPAVLAGDEADAVTAGTDTAIVAARVASTTVRRVDRITVLLVGRAFWTLTRRWFMTGKGSVQDRTPVDEENPTGHKGNTRAREPGAQCAGRLRL